MTSNNVKISIITPSFNQAAYIGKTIDSVMSQHCAYPFEHIIIDGGSDDGTVDILKKYTGRVKWISAPDEGQADAINKGISMASGEIIGWLNSDDQYILGALQKVVDYFETHPNCRWLYGRCLIIDEDDREIRRWITCYKNFLSRRFSYKRLLIENFISQPSVFIKRELLDETGLTDPGLQYVMDYDLWLRIGKIATPGIIHEALACFRVHGQSKSQTQYKKQFQEEYRIHKKYHQGKLLLFLHKLNIYKITGIYWLMHSGGKVE